VSAWLPGPGQIAHHEQGAQTLAARTPAGLFLGSNILHQPKSAGVDQRSRTRGNRPFGRSSRPCPRHVERVILPLPTVPTVIPPARVSRTTAPLQSSLPGLILPTAQAAATQFHTDRLYTLQDAFAVPVPELGP
jgi:hypothetical protein